MVINMDKKVIIAILLINFTAFSCNFVAKDNNSVESDTKEFVTIYDYQILTSNLDKKDLRDSVITYVDTLYLNNRKNIIFFINDSISIYYHYAIEKDSLFLENLYCHNLDTIHINYKDKDIELIKSIYDVEDIVDEEMYVYWNQDYGLVALYNYPWGSLILFDKETMKGFAKEIFYNYFISQKKINQS